MSRDRGDRDRGGYERRDERSVECKVYVGDLHRDTTEKDLERSFGYYGPLKSVWIARSPAGFAFIEYEDVRDAEDAVRGLDGTNICGSRVRCEHSTGKIRPKPWMRGGGGGGGRGGGGGGGGGRGGSRTFNPDDKCYECGGRGHYAYDCRNRGGGGGGGDRDRRRSRSRSPRGRSPRRSYSRSRSRSRSRSHKKE